MTVYLQRIRVSASSAILPLGAAGLSAWLAPLSLWVELRPALLPALSVIAAAVLVRLARGLPFTNADHFSLKEFRSVATKLEANARKLRALIFICLIALAFLIFAPSPVIALSASQGTPEWLRVAIQAISSGFIALLVVYAFTRVVEVVHSDVSLLRLQSKILEAAIAAKTAKKFEDSIQGSVKPGIAGADKFGTTRLN